jgi:hypothetical protein
VSSSKEPIWMTILMKEVFMGKARYFVKAAKGRLFERTLLLSLPGMS